MEKTSNKKIKLNHNNTELVNTDQHNSPLQFCPTLETSAIVSKSNLYESTDQGIYNVYFNKFF